MINTINACRICNSNNLEEVVNLGKQALSGVFPKDINEEVERFSLILVKCSDCGLVQLKHSVSQDLLYHDNYGYRSGINSTMRNHLASIVKSVESKVNLNDGDYVLDIASNDGTLLNAYKNKKLNRFGVDPSSKQFGEYYEEDIIKIPSFFNAEVLKPYTKNNKFKVVTSIAVLYDLEKPDNFVESVKNILDIEGIWVLEQSDLGSMIQANSYDTICHEHLEYYSITVLKSLLAKHEFVIFDADLNDSNGGSHRLYVCNKRSSIKINANKVSSLIEKEKKLSLTESVTYHNFMKSCNSEMNKLKSFIDKETEKGKRIHIYGASTKGNVLLQYCYFNSSQIEMAAERNPRKLGCFTPGTKIPINSEEISRNKKPDYYLVLPWHFKKEFIIREAEFLRKGGALIFPLPKFEIFLND